MTSQFFSCKTTYLQYCPKNHLKLNIMLSIWTQSILLYNAYKPCGSPSVFPNFNVNYFSIHGYDFRKFLKMKIHSFVIRRKPTYNWPRVTIFWHVVYYGGKVAIRAKTIFHKNWFPRFWLRTDDILLFMLYLDSSVFHTL